MRHYRPLFGLFLALSLSTVTAIQADEKKPKPAASAKQARLNGTVQSISKDPVGFTLRRDNDERKVVYDQYTTITYRNRPSTADEIKEGRRLICLGKINDKNELVASRIDIRDGK
jgi:hypothetical protein